MEYGSGKRPRAEPPLSARNGKRTKGWWWRAIESTSRGDLKSYRPERIVGEIRRFNGEKWTCEEVKMKRDSTYDIALHHGGNIKVYSNLINPLNQIKVEEELIEDPKLFREYPIQGGREPRANLFFHEKATDDEIQLQPGYQYRSTRMKAISYNGFPGLERVAKQTAEHCSVPYWNIGVNAVCYRDGNDSMGYHTDNDQGEDTILTCLISSPPTPRVVRIRVIRKGKYVPGIYDEEIVLRLQAGDAYEMDGVMQNFYEHGVPKDTKQTGDEKMRRIVLVFRHGIERYYDRDTGRPIKNLEPRDVSLKYCIGQLPGLKEGMLYPRMVLYEMGAHCMVQKGISGNINFGCDAIIVSGAREDGDGHDEFSDLVYCAETKVGGGAIMKSMASKIPIRVFRSSVLQNPYQAFAANRKKNASALYRYDGIYRVIRVFFVDEESRNEVWESPEHLSPVVSNRLYRFSLRRVEAGNDGYSNTMSDDQLLDYCRSQGTMLPASGAPLARVPIHLPDNFDFDGTLSDQRLAAHQLLDIRGRPRHNIAMEFFASQILAALRWLCRARVKGTAVQSVGHST